MLSSAYWPQWLQFPLLNWPQCNCGHRLFFCSSYTLGQISFSFIKIFIVLKENKTKQKDHVWGQSDSSKQSRDKGLRLFWHHRLNLWTLSWFPPKYTNNTPYSNNELFRFLQPLPPKCFLPAIIPSLASTARDR